MSKDIPPPMTVKTEPTFWGEILSSLEMVRYHMEKVHELVLEHMNDRCDHMWVDARNEVVMNGAVCLRCGRIRAENIDSQESNEVGS